MLYNTTTTTAVITKNNILRNCSRRIIQYYSSSSRTTTTTRITKKAIIRNSEPTNQQQRYYSKGWTGGRGYDITNDIYEYNNNTIMNQDGTMNIPKINISGYDDTGFIVQNMIQPISSISEKDSDGSVYIYNSSIIALPYGCFIWDHIHRPQDVTIESLLFLLLIRPKIEYLFIGCQQNSDYGSIVHLNTIQNTFRNHPYTNSTIVVEQMQLYNAIGTFNLLNAEDRQVAAAFILDK